MLVSEDEGGEIDVGAGRCHMMEAIEMRGTKANADTEEWDIVRLTPYPYPYPLPLPLPLPLPYNRGRCASSCPRRPSGPSRSRRPTGSR